MFKDGANGTVTAVRCEVVAGVIIFVVARFTTIFVVVISDVKDVLFSEFHVSSFQVQCYSYVV